MDHEHREELLELNAKVLDGTASEEHKARWEELKTSARPAGASGSPRSHARADISAEVRFEDVDQVKDACLAFNLGAGGMAVELPESPDEGTEVQLAITLPGDSEPMSVRAVVVWKGEGRTIGLEFLEIDDQSRERIDALVWAELGAKDGSWSF